MVITKPLPVLFRLKQRSSEVSQIIFLILLGLTYVFLRERERLHILRSLEGERGERLETPLSL